MRTTYCPNCNDKVRYYTDFGANNSWLRICTDCETDLNFNFKLCILGAGKGTRNKGVDGLHKALLPIENKPVISHVLDNFDDRVEVVVALGYEGEQIKSYLSDVYPNKKITYVNVDNYDGIGSGPGFSLLKCKKYLQTPFISHACDSLIKNKIEKLTHNWLGYDKITKRQLSKFVSFDNSIFISLDNSIFIS